MGLAIGTPVQFSIADGFALKNQGGLLRYLCGDGLDLKVDEEAAGPLGLGLVPFDQDLLSLRRGQEGQH